MKFTCLLFCSALLLVTVSCDGDGGGAPTDTFNRTEMLTNVADKTVLPLYATLVAQSQSLLETTTAVADSPTPSASQIEQLRTAVAQFFSHWQGAYPYDFGPAEGPLGSLVINVSTFPADTAGIETLIAASDTVFQNFRRDTRGLCALDYLLFSSSPDAVAQRLAGSAGVNRRRYLVAVVRAIHAEVSAVYNVWNTTYRTQFISRAGTDAGSSTSLLFNHLNVGFEALKNFKVALPMGRRAGQQQSEPTRVEAYYQGNALELARKHFEACAMLWEGRTSDGATFPSFKAYLGTVTNGARLIEDTEAQIARVRASFDALPANARMSDLVVTNPESLEPLLTELQKLTRYWKSEMSSLLGVSITYSSGDGD